MLVGVSAFAFGGTDIPYGDSKITLMGNQKGGGTYEIAVMTELAHPEQYDGLLIVTEPTHTVLLVQNNGPERKVLLEEGEAPLAVAEGQLNESAPKVVIPYVSTGDIRVVVQLTKGKERITISNARINVASFHTSTSFYDAAAGPDLPISGHHCITCGSCGTMCINCSGPQWSADCVACTIQCGW